MAARNARLPSPFKVFEDFSAGWRSMALAAAIDLDLFTRIAEGKRTPAELASAIGADAHAVARLCDAMTALKYLRKKNESYALEPVADTYLVRGRELYMEGQGTIIRMQMAAWSQLAESVKSGKPVTPRDLSAAGEFFRVLVRAIFPRSYVPAKAAVAAIPKPARARIRNILDVAAGSGAWSLPFAQALPHARVTALDLPAVLPVTREYAERFKVADRYDYLAGDLRELDFSQNRYDLVILGHVLHGEGREGSPRLIRKAAAALREKGMMLIAEFIPNDQRTGPPIPLLFGLNMLVNSPGGDVFTMREYREWLKAAGMKSIRTIKAPGPSPLILATR
jgi:ubiquinone/menaquinone biosynthesis C-methylase UbiE